MERKTLLFIFFKTLISNFFLFYLLLFTSIIHDFCLNIDLLLSFIKEDIARHLDYLDRKETSKITCLISSEYFFCNNYA